ncbi:MAG TPA: hypothetical protein VF511_05145, partial [Chthoniobacterales bacterium]
MKIPSQFGSRASQFRRCYLFFALLCTNIALGQNSWTVVDTPNPSSNNSHLKGIAALTSSDVWAVGFYTDNAAGAFLNLAMHWNGSSWTITPTPNPSQPNTDQLKKVAAVASNDVWAVGGHGLSVILRWNGAQWTQVPRPPVNFNAQYTNVAHDLDDIAAIASNDIWAVGWLDAQNGGSITLTMHWDGVQWTQIPSPNVPMPSGSFYSQRLEAVTAIAPNDVWAVGFYRVGNTEHPLSMRWNGTQWNLVPTPDGPPTPQAPNGDGWLHGIAAAGPNDIWAVGEYNKVDFNSFAKPFAMHWNGASWTVVLPPNPGYLGVAPLNSVVARGPNDFLAVGEVYNSNQGFNTFVVRWNGSTWTQVPSETPAGTGTGWNQLHDVARDSSGGLWTAGVKQASFSSGNYTLVERSPVAAPVPLVSAASWKQHDTQAYGIALPLSGTPGMETRDAGPSGDHTIVFTFAQTLNGVGEVTVAGSGKVSGSRIDP